MIRQTPPVDPDAPRIFLDSSVILAGATSETGASHAILALGELGLLTLITTRLIFNEVENNIAKKLRRADPRYQQVRLSINWEILDAPTDQQIGALIQIIPLKDAPILAAAMSAAPARLVTLDTKHFIEPPEVAAASGLTIVTPGDLLRDVRSALGTAIRPRTS